MTDKEAIKYLQQLSPEGGCKAEELSRQYVLPFLDKRYEKYGEHEQMKLSKFDGYDMISSYEEGYHQAEKDLELTWKDIREICKMWIESKTPFGETGEELSKEVLKRFLKSLKDRLK